GFGSELCSFDCETMCPGRLERGAGGSCLPDALGAPTPLGGVEFVVGIDLGFVANEGAFTGCGGGGLRGCCGACAAVGGAGPGFVGGDLCGEAAFGGWDHLKAPENAKAPDMMSGAAGGDMRRARLGNG